MTDRITRSQQSRDLGQEFSHPSRIPVGEAMVQTISHGVVKHADQVIQQRGSLNGVAYVASGYLADVIHFTSTGASQAKQGSPQRVTEVLLMAHPDNGDAVWVRPYEAATVNNAFPLYGGDIIGFSINDMADLHMLFVASGDTLIVGPVF